MLIKVPLICYGCDVYLDVEEGHEFLADSFAKAVEELIKAADATAEVVSIKRARDSLYGNK